MNDSPAAISQRISVENAMITLKREMRENHNYAYTWQSNIACCAMDEGVEHEAANRIALRFMSIAFDVTQEPIPFSLPAEALTGNESE